MKGKQWITNKRGITNEESGIAMQFVRVKMEISLYREYGT
jgi:hypothetical protein